MEPRRYPIALFLPRIVIALIAFGRHLVQCMTGNTWFATPNPPLAQVTTDLDALDAAETLAKQRAPGSAAARDLKKKVVLDDIEALKAYVHSIMMANIASAMAIVLSAGMSPKQFGLRTKLPIDAFVSDVPGEAILRAKAVAKGRVAYEWQISSDSGKTWVDIGITTDADTTAEGLVAGSVYMFRVRATVKKTTGAWTQAVTFLMH
jgi:hypothetical protein